MPGKMTPPDVNDLVELYASGQSANSIMKIYSIKFYRLKAACVNAGVWRGKKIISQETKGKVIERYLAGESSTALAKEFGVGSTTVKRWVDASGLNKFKKRARGCRRMLEVKAQEVLDMYEEGVGVRGIEKAIPGLDAGGIIRFLKEKGVHVRNQPEQQQARMDRSTPEQIARLTKAAHEASRGRSQTWEEKAKRAKSKEGKLTPASNNEIILAGMLRSHGLKVSHQTAVGIYNCDLTIGSIAVEVWGGGWHWYGDHRRSFDKRLRYLFNCGWNVLIVPVTSYFPLTAETASYLAGQIDIFRRNPPTVCEYRVIWGAGDFVIGGNANDTEFNIGKPICNPPDIAV